MICLIGSGFFRVYFQFKNEQSNFNYHWSLTQTKLKKTLYFRQAGQAKVYCVKFML